MHATAAQPDPLILTLRMGAAAAARFTALRRQHFPAARNFLDAHITLFHALPGSAVERVATDVEAMAGCTSTFTLQAQGLLFFGHGVAYGLRSPDAEQLRLDLAQRWRDLLGRQDANKRGRLHITVQNKVSAAAARALHDSLLADFVPEDVVATGLELWRYLGGPWQAVASWDFKDPRTTANAAGSGALDAPLETR